MAEAFLWGLLAGSSLILGAVLVRFHRPHAFFLGLVMAFGAGVLLSAVSFELVEEAVSVSMGPFAPAIGFAAGALVFTAGDAVIGRFGYRNRKDIDGEPADASPLTIVLGTFLDGVPESAVLGLTLLQTGEVGVAMLVAVFISNVPESIAASTGLRNGGWSDRSVALLWSAIAVVAGLSAAAGYVLLDGASSAASAIVLAFAGGAILAMLATAMMPEAYEHAHRAAGAVTVLGFAVAFGISHAFA